MSQCCSSNQETNPCRKKHACPVNGKTYSSVSWATMLHHIKNPWQFESQQRCYYFCDDPACDVVYFADDGTCIDKSMLRTSVGIKEQDQNSLVCYCFGVTKALAQSDPKVKSFIMEQTKNGVCSCEVCNPSGRCCLKEFPK